MSKLATKDREGKLRFDLIPPEVDRGYAEVLSLGANKYDDRNWEKGLKFSDIIASLKRHLNKFESGEEINIDDGDLHHSKHILFWAAALVTFTSRGRSELNDLPAYNKPQNAFWWEQVDRDTDYILSIELSDQKIVEECEQMGDIDSKKRG